MSRSAVTCPAGSMVSSMKYVPPTANATRRLLPVAGSAKVVRDDGSLYGSVGNCSGPSASRQGFGVPG